MKSRYVIAFALLVFGGLVFWLNKPEAPDNSRDSKSDIAQIDTLEGNASLKNSQDEISTASSHSKIFENDSLSTDQDSHLSFHLSSGAKFEMAPLTKVIFEYDANHQTTLTVLEGQLQVLSEEKANFEVTKKGKSLSLGELKTPIESPKASPSPEPSPAESSATVNSKTKMASRETSTLDQEDINRVMRNQTSFLHRCYINYMLRSQRLDLSGQVVLSFTIQPTGKVSNAKIISSPIQDEQLDHCLTDVVSRSSFKEFNSQAILIQAYPIHLD